MTVRTGRIAWGGGGGSLQAATSATSPSTGAPRQPPFRIVFPIACILAAWAIVRLAELAGRRAPALRPALYALGAVLLLGQGVVYSIHDGLVLSKADTRNLARAWLVANVPPRTKIVGRG